MSKENYTDDKHFSGDVGLTATLDNLKKIERDLLDFYYKSQDEQAQVIGRSRAWIAGAVMSLEEFLANQPQ